MELKAAQERITMLRSARDLATEGAIKAEETLKQYKAQIDNCTKEIELLQTAIKSGWLK